MKKLALIALVFAFTLGSCVFDDPDDLNEDQVWTQYELFYDGNTDKTYARATFRLGGEFGSLWKLSASAKVVFNSQRLNLSPLADYYELVMNGKVDSGGFVYSSPQGNNYTNAIRWNPIDYPANLDTIDRSSAYDVVWQGASLGKNEYVTFVVNGDVPDSSRVFSVTAVAEDRVVLDKATLSTIQPGTELLWLDRAYQPLLSQSGSGGGRIFGRYRPANQTVYFK